MSPDSAPAETPPTEPPADARGEGADGAVRFSHYEILPNQRLKHLDQGPVLAYAARPVGHTGMPGYFALVGETWLIPRIKTAEVTAGISNPGFVRIVQKGVEYWPPAKGERYIFIYENNLGQPLMRAIAGQGLAWKNEKALLTLIKPMAGVLVDLRDRDTVHGRINPMNMFDGGARTLERVILGDCVATPPSYMQPALFEPIERAQCDALGRGLGTFEDDMYALGVSLTIVLRTRDPMEGMSDEDIIREKIEQGSYVALTGKERFTGAILELLRGLLYDDRAQRWTLNDMLLWLDGQRLSPKQSARKLKAGRQIQFNGARYSRPAMLAMDLDKNPAEAVRLVDGGELEQWLQRSLEDNTVKNRYEQAVELTHDQGRGAGYPEKLVARVSMALDPDAPIRYRGVHVTPAGFPDAMLEAVYFKKDLNPYIDMINNQFVMYWLNAQNDMRYDVGDTMARFDSCRAFMRQQGIIYGMERCLYFLAADAPCVSDRLRAYYVRSPEDLLRAFEGLSEGSDGSSLFIDRHIAAFLSVRDRKVIDPYLAELNAPEKFKRVMGNVRVLAAIQQRGKLGAFPGIGKWIAGVLDSYYERVHDRELRVKLRERMAKLADGGDIGKMIALLDNMEMKQRDFKDYRQGMIDYNRLREEAAELERKLAQPEVYAREAAREYAAAIAALVAGLVIIVFVFIHLSQGGVL